MSGRQDASPPSPRDVKIIALEAELEEYKKRESKTNQVLNELTRRSRDLENELYLAKESTEGATVSQVEEEVQKDETII